MGLFKMSSFKCDYKPNCRKKPRYEIIFPQTEHRDGFWCYVCFWHLIVAKIKATLRMAPGFGWCEADTTRQMVENIMEEIWELKSDIWDIKEKLGIIEKDDDKIDIDVT